MVLILAGLGLWFAAHLFKRVAPAARAKLGAPGAGLVALCNVGAIVLMVFGYMHADPVLVWSLPPVSLAINNLLVFVALYLFVASNMKAGVTVRLRHPQLIGVVLWAIAHLLVNGDQPSILLFGGLFVWAIVEMVVINRSAAEWTRGPAVAMPRELAAVGATLVTFALVGALHTWLGPWPFVLWT